MEVSPIEVQCIENKDTIRIPVMLNECRVLIRKG